MVWQHGGASRASGEPCMWPMVRNRRKALAPTREPNRKQGCGNGSSRSGEAPATDPLGAARRGSDPPLADGRSVGARDRNEKARFARGLVPAARESLRRLDDTAMPAAGCPATDWKAAGAVGVGSNAGPHFLLALDCAQAGCKLRGFALPVLTYWSTLRSGSRTRTIFASA